MTRRWFVRVRVWFDKNETARPKGKAGRSLYRAGGTAGWVIT